MKFKDEWLDLSDGEFEREIGQWFLKMKGVGMSPGYQKSTRVEHVQTAVDAVWGWAQFKDGITAGHNGKWAAISRKHMSTFGQPLPVPSPSIAEKLLKVGVATAKENLLNEKLACLEHWLKGPDPECFLQGDEESVQSTLKDLVADARQRAAVTVKEPWMDVWTGFDAKKSVEWTKERESRAVKGTASFRAGASAEGKFELEVKGLKIKASTAGFIGVRGHVKGSATASMERTGAISDAVSSGDALGVGMVGIKADAEAFIEAGIHLSADASVGLGDVLEASVAGEAFAGAMARAKASISLSSDGIALEASAKAFVGVELTGSAAVTLKWKGRDIWTQKADASLTFGAGAEASFKLAMPRLGPTTFEVSAGLTLGLGTKVGTKVEFNCTNLQLAGEQFFYEEVRQFLTPRALRYELMMGDKANQKTCEQCIAELKGLLTAVQAEKTRLKGARFR